MSGKEENERAVTVLELIAFAFVVIAVVYLVIVLAGSQPAAGSTGDQGLIPTAAGATGKTLRIVGTVTVFAATNNNPSDVSVRYPVPDSTRMGSLESNVALLIGDDGGVDFDKINLVWIANGTAERIPRTDTRPLVCPGWTIAGKYNVIPMKSANSNNILEPGEQFLIFVCPASPLPAYRSFNVRIEDSGGYQSPFLGGIAPVMNSRIGSLM
jgi:hypothetical protein